MAFEQNVTADLIHVCGLPAVPDLVLASRARHLVTCLSDGGPEQTPLGIMEGRHLKLVMHDIDEEREGYTLPSEAHVAELLDFVGKWDRTAPMIIHCYAGISRSTAAAFIALCALNPGTAEALIARRLREASAWATPNRRLVRLGDAALSRDGRMVEAIAGIGMGEISLARPFWISATVS
jgi:predicted protein tyrosine phosphatase